MDKFWEAAEKNLEFLVSQCPLGIDWSAGNEDFKKQIHENLDLSSDEKIKDALCSMDMLSEKTFASVRISLMAKRT